MTSESLARLTSATPRTSASPPHCEWCGREIVAATVGRRRRYCRQSCRQRAYEQRHAFGALSIPEGALILGEEDARALIDRAYEVRCAAEDIATAAQEGADAAEIRVLAEQLVELARNAERIR